MFDKDEEENIRLSTNEKKTVLEITEELTPQIIETIIKVKNTQPEVHFEDVLDASPALFGTYSTLIGMDFPNLRKKKEEIQNIISKYISNLIAVHSITTNASFNDFINQAQKALGKSLLLKIYKATLDNSSSSSLNELLPDLENKSIERIIRGIDILMHLKQDILKHSLGAQITIKFINNAIKEQFNPRPTAQSTSSTSSSTTYPSQYSGTHFKPAESTKKPAFPNNSNASAGGGSNSFKSQQSEGFKLEDLLNFKSQAQKSLAELRRNSIISNCELFRAISDNAPTSEIAAIISKKPHLLQAKDIKGNNALHIAVVFQNDETVKWLCDQGVDMNHVNNEGTSVLQMSICSGSKAAIYLMENGAYEGQRSGYSH